MRRVLVIGISGAGKSTFSRALAGKTGLPLIHLDKEFWQPGWAMTPRAEWRGKVTELVARDAWIMDAISTAASICGCRAQTQWCGSTILRSCAWAGRYGGS